MLVAVCSKKGVLQAVEQKVFLEARENVLLENHAYLQKLLILETYMREIKIQSR